MRKQLKKTVFFFYFFFANYVSNNIIALIPIWKLRKAFYKVVGMNIGRNSQMGMSQYIIEPRKISIGKFSHINQGCFLDGRGSISIGNSVSISHRVSLVTGSHDSDSRTFSGIFEPIIIEDYVWIGINVTILQNVTIGKGAVVAAGAVVTKNVDDYSIVAGIPAKVIGKRNQDLDYKCSISVPFV